MSEPLSQAVVVVVEHAGRTLLVRRADGLPGAGRWGPLAGRIEPGESPADAARREAREEVGLAVVAGDEVHRCLAEGAPFELIWVAASPDERTPRPATVRVAGPEPMPALRLAPDEVSEARWCTLAEALTLEPMFEATRAFFRSRVPGPLATPADAAALLVALGAGPWLVRHHELVAEAAGELLAGLPRELRARVDERRVWLGAALHDAGKILVPAEATGPGCEHEATGEVLLRQAGVNRELARSCRTHARWDEPDATVDDRLVALADKLWKGKRDGSLEEVIKAEMAPSGDRWASWVALDDLFERVAAKGPLRLARSHVA
ncbi:MAG: NUDIX domain-containing protein [Myxococcales bacterium]|nr:MAG: NUDIX domain-containing protein [Myxococcales bacterium]